MPVIDFLLCLGSFVEFSCMGTISHFVFLIEFIWIYPPKSQLQYKLCPSPHTDRRGCFQDAFLAETKNKAFLLWTVVWKTGSSLPQYFPCESKVNKYFWYHWWVAVSSDNRVIMQSLQPCPQTKVMLTRARMSYSCNNCKMFYSSSVLRSKSLKTVTPSLFLCL